MTRPMILCLLSVSLLVSCEDQRFKTYKANVPRYMTYAELRASFRVDTGVPLEKPGKIYFKDQYMYINEYHRGIHVVDLSEPSDPEVKVFIHIPGSVDMAIREEVLYADSYTDLVLVDISDPIRPREINRVADLFEYVIPPHDREYPLDRIDPEKGVVTGFEVREITREVEPDPHPWPVYTDYGSFAESGASMLRSPAGAGAGSTYGVAGSMARFLTYDMYLYVLESTYKLKSIDISRPDNPALMNEQYLWGNIETLFISENHMYVGSSNGLHILSLSQPSVPSLLSTYRHMTACDPVVVSGNRAYVTLRAGNLCGGDQNLLEVIDITDKYDPQRMASYAMTEPYGLGIDGSTLFICEGEHGLKIYDASDPYSITSHKIAEFGSIRTRDVIPLASFLFAIGDSGFYIYDYSDLSDINLLATIPVTGSGD